MSKRIHPVVELKTEIFTGSDGQSIEITHGSGNVFADLGLPDAEERKFKSRLIMQAMDAISASGLTQTRAAEVTGVDQSRISKMMRGKFDSITIDMLFKMLNRLGHQVEVRVSPRESGNAEMVLLSPADVTRKVAPKRTGTGPRASGASAYGRPVKKVAKTKLVKNKV